MPATLITSPRHGDYYLVDRWRDAPATDFFPIVTAAEGRMLARVKDHAPQLVDAVLLAKRVFPRAQLLEVRAPRPRRRRARPASAPRLGVSRSHGYVYDPDFEAGVDDD